MQRANAQNTTSTVSVNAQYMVGGCSIIVNTDQQFLTFFVSCGFSVTVFCSVFLLVCFLFLLVCFGGRGTVFSR